jgi:hypothetical protein
VFVVGSDPEAPLDREDLRAYRQQLKHYLAGAYPDKSHGNVEKSWGKLQAKSRISMDENGHPVLQMRADENPVEVGLAPGNVLESDAPPELVRQLLAARLQAELSRRSSHGISETEVARDWEMLQKSIAASETQVSAGGLIRSGARGSQP